MFKRFQHSLTGLYLRGVFKCLKTVQPVYVSVVNSADFVLYKLLDVFPNALSGYFLPIKKIWLSLHPFPLFCYFLKMFVYFSFLKTHL